MSIAFLFDFGKSLMCPTDARTVILPPALSADKYFSMVFAFDGDSTINNLITGAVLHERLFIGKFSLFLLFKICATLLIYVWNSWIHRNKKSLPNLDQRIRAS